ncbi:hypothetical protein FPSE_06263 [Fusarium pseudograminearum CS3096]|uniref:Uncharacterized protein n=1 Tax=Fusarium pseudograminearum (strain CS3096) TaxID=1028729 RepID=K3W072_FUSPC|nr:hypothetical protein FPSE_06263 [Fusarium pseudograminearum CS3096]EKJ73645.1 hypothetical protein FPSE_06263 [Fusarium pseudograminearum CS3096]
MVERLRPEIYPNHGSGSSSHRSGGSDFLDTSGGIAIFVVGIVIAAGVILGLLSHLLQSRRTGHFDYQSRGTQAGHSGYQTRGTQTGHSGYETRGTQTDAE